MLDQITPLVIAYNEAPNIARTLSKLRWAKRLVIVDSGSTDGTLDMISAIPQAEVFHRNFDSFANQCNFGLAQVQDGWCLSLDADYVLSDELVEEIAGLKQDDSVNGYRARFTYLIHGRALRGSLYPPRTILHRKGFASYRDDGHGHRVEVMGRIADLSSSVFHDDRKPLDRWFKSQRDYARIEARHLLNAVRSDLTMKDKLRLMAWPAPALVFVYALFAKGCIVDGWPGWFYALQRLLAETALTLEIIELRASGRQATIDRETS